MKNVMLIILLVFCAIVNATDVQLNYIRYEDYNDGIMYDNSTGKYYGKAWGIYLQHW